jgi:hypothetical protein
MRKYQKFESEEQKDLYYENGGKLCDKCDYDCDPDTVISNDGCPLMRD